jgi:hypothetical protein
MTFTFPSKFQKAKREQASGAYSSPILRRIKRNESIVAMPVIPENETTNQEVAVSSGVEVQSSSTAPANSNNNLGERWQQSEEAKRNVTRLKQARLLLLRHGALCQCKDDNCPVTPHCAAMKKLWAHLGTCKDKHCRVIHCFTSKYVLTHFQRCKNSLCTICSPVHEVIQRSASRYGLQGTDPLLLNFDHHQGRLFCMNTNMAALNLAPQPK